MVSVTTMGVLWTYEMLCTYTYIFIFFPWVKLMLSEIYDWSLKFVDPYTIAYISIHQ